MTGLPELGLSPVLVQEGRWTARLGDTLAGSVPLEILLAAVSGEHCSLPTLYRASLNPGRE